METAPERKTGKQQRNVAERCVSPYSRRAGRRGLGKTYKVVYGETRGRIRDYGTTKETNRNTQRGVGWKIRITEAARDISSHTQRNGGVALRTTGKPYLFHRETHFRVCSSDAAETDVGEIMRRRCARVRLPYRLQVRNGSNTTKEGLQGRV